MYNKYIIHHSILKKNDNLLWVHKIAVTRQDASPLPRVQDCIDTVRGSVYFSTFDITSGYMNDQGPVKEEQP